MNFKPKFEFKLNFLNRDISDKDLLDDIVIVSKNLNNVTPTFRDYDKLGKYSPSTIMTRFGSWNNAIKLVGLNINREFHKSNEELFENLKNIWLELGRQPTYRECKKPLSKFDISVYDYRFGTWKKALYCFIEYIYQNEPEENSETTIGSIEEEIAIPENRIIHKTKRELSERMRFRILLRDGFRCKSCGKSPINNPGVELHVDHKIPWSKGGETVDENLECKCKECNLGKGNAFNE